MKGSTEFNCIIVRIFRGQAVIKMTSFYILYLLSITESRQHQSGSSPPPARPVINFITITSTGPPVGRKGCRSSPFSCLDIYKGSWLVAGAVIIKCRGLSKSFQSCRRQHGSGDVVTEIKLKLILCHLPPPAQWTCEVVSPSLMSGCMIGIQELISVNKLISLLTF